jgi:serine/threonine protein kinase
MSTLVANRFIVTQRLQKGGFGEVFIAQDLFTSQYVAIKIVRISYIM